MIGPGSEAGAAGGGEWKDLLWRATARRADKWQSVLGASDYEVRMVRFGIRDMPTVPFTKGVVMGEIPQDERDLEFGLEELGTMVQSGMVEEVGWEEVGELVRGGKMVSNSFVVWQGEGDSKKGRFVVNFSEQSRHWPKGRVRMETIQSFAVEMQERDMLMSFDVKGGYRHFYLHPDMRDFFVFRYGGRCYRCVALPFGWGRSGWWFVKLLRPFVRHVREKLGYRVLPYVDDFLIAPSPPGRVAGEEDCERARKELGRLMRRLGLWRHPEKGEWTGSRQIDHLGVRLDTAAMKVYVTDEKVRRVRKMAAKLLALAVRNRRLVPTALVKSFCGTAVSLMLGLPLARFYTRSLYFDMVLAGKREREASEEWSSGENFQGCRRGCRGFVVSSAKAGWAACRAHEAQSLPRRSRGSDKRHGRSLPKGGGADCGGNGRMRLCRQSLRDLRYWRSLARGEGRDLVRLPPDVTMHSDAADVGYGGTLGFDETAGSSGLWEGRGFWTMEDRAQSITLRELRAVRLLLHRHFCDFVSDPHIRRILLHEDNQAVVYILNAMVSASRPMMAELRKIEKLLRVLGVRIDSRWIPSAVNRFADSLSRTWDPGDIEATESVVRDLVEEHGLDAVAFGARPFGERLAARRKYLDSEMEANWNDGRSRLFNPPADLVPVVLRKLETGGGHGVLVVPTWRAQPWFARLRAIAVRCRHVKARPGGRVLWEGRPGKADRWGITVATVDCRGSGLME